MRVGFWRAGRALALLALGVAAPSLAGAALRSAEQWLGEMQIAVRTQSYSGQVVQQRGSQRRVSRIVQRVDGETIVQRVQMLDGAPIEFIRRRAPGVDEVRCYRLDQRRIVLERRVLETRFPTIFGLPPVDIVRNYALKLGPLEPVAAHRTQVIELQPRDGLRHAYRVWAEQTTGLPLRLQILDGSKMVEQIGFVDIDLVHKPTAAQVAPAWPTQGWSTETPAFESVEAAAHGWSVRPPTGFILRSSVLRRSSAPDRAAPTLQLFFSDGLAHVSVFVEDPAIGPEAPDRALERGVLSVMTRRVGAARVTALGEVTAAGAHAAAQSVQWQARPAAAFQGGSNP